MESHDVGVGVDSVNELLERSFIIKAKPKNVELDKHDTDLQNELIGNDPEEHSVW